MIGLVVLGGYLLGATVVSGVFGAWTAWQRCFGPDELPEGD